MTKRIKDGGTNAATLAGAVNTGQFASDTKSESSAILEAGTEETPEPLRFSKALSARLEEIRKLTDYREDVYSHFTMNNVAASTKALHPDAQTMVFDIEDEGAYMTKVVLKDGSEVPIDTDSELNDDLHDANWTDDYTYRACGYNDSRYAYINVDDALDVPEYLTDPSFLDAPAVPSSADIRADYRQMSSLAELDYATRCLGRPAEDPTWHEARTAEIETRRAELLAAGVTR